MSQAAQNSVIRRLGVPVPYVMTVVDHYSRFVKCYPLKSKHTQAVVEALSQYVADCGAPQGIVPDNGGEFTSQAFQQFCQKHLITLYYTTPYQPQGNGVVERRHRTLKSTMAALCQGHPSRKPRLLQSCQAAMKCLGKYWCEPSSL